MTSLGYGSIGEENEYSLVPWLPICKGQLHSQDLSPLDFFPWNYLKNIVYKDASQSIAEFKKKIEDAVR